MGLLNGLALPEGEQPRRKPRDLLSSSPGSSHALADPASGALLPSWFLPTPPLGPCSLAGYRRNIKTLVLDEADEMLNKGFKEQIYDIYRYLPPETQASPGDQPLMWDVGVGCCGSAAALPAGWLHPCTPAAVAGARPLA